MIQWSRAIGATCWLLVAVVGQEPPLPSPVPELIPLLRSKDPEVRRAAAEQLGQVSWCANGLPGISAATELLALFANDPSLPVCESAALALAEFGTWPLAAFELAEASCDRWRESGADPTAVDRVRAALAAADKAWPGTTLVPPLVELLRVRPCVPSVLSILAALGEGAIAAGPVVDQLLADAEAGVRWRAAFALCRLGVTDTPALRRACDDRQLPVRLWASRARLSVASPEPASVSLLLPWLDDARRPVRIWALQRVVAFGAGSGPAVVRIADQLDEVVRRNEIWPILQALKQHAAPAVPSLLPLLETSDGTDNWRTPTIDLLGEIGPAANSSVPALLAILAVPPEQRDQDWPAISAARALARIAPEHALASLLPPLERRPDSEHEADWYDVKRFSQLGATAAPAVPRLQAMLVAPDRSTRVRALLALEGLGEHALPALSAIEPLLDGDDERLRRLARKVAIAIGPSAAEVVVPRLDRLYGRASERWRDEAQRYVHQLGGAVEPWLIRMSASEDPDRRRSAIRELMWLRGLSAAGQQAVLARLDADDDVVGDTVLSSLFSSNVGPFHVEAVRTMIAKTKVAGLREGGLDALWHRSVWSVPTVRRDWLDDSCFRLLLGAWGVAGRSAADCARLLAPEASASWAITFTASADGAQRAAAATILGWRPSTADSRGHLAKLAVDVDMRVRRAAVRALGRHGRAAREQLPVLAKALHDSDWYVRANAAEALRAVHRE